MSDGGKPSELHPARVARDLGLPVRGGMLEWADLLEAACDLYWQRRVPITPAELRRWKREHDRAATSPDVWLRRAGAA